MPEQAATQAAVDVVDVERRLPVRLRPELRVVAWSGLLFDSQKVVNLFSSSEGYHEGIISIERSTTDTSEDYAKIKLYF